MLMNAEPTRAGGYRRTIAVVGFLAGACWFPLLSGEEGLCSRHNDSWAWVDSSCNSGTLVEGEKWEVPVEYYLDPAEDDGGTTMTVWIGGPWIDCPDGKYEKKRHHVSYPGSFRRAAVKAGRKRHTFSFTVPPALDRNSMLIVCQFRDASGKSWPWHVRRGGIWLKRKGGFFEIETDRPGNLFLYQDPVRIVCRLRKVQKVGEGKSLKYRVHDTRGELVAEGEVAFTAEENGQEIPLPLGLERRGTFYVEAEVEGWEKQGTTFCRIPDVLAATQGEKTPFGMTSVVAPGPSDRLEEMCRIAQRLGLTACRTMHHWDDLEPGPGIYKLEPWEKALDIGSRYGIDTWLCIYGPPAWAFPDNAKSFRTSYSAVRVRWDAWRDFVSTVSTRLKGKLYGWEWLNEITPGGTESFVDDYVTMCRIGTEAAKAVDPDLVTLLAGGLWPRSFRTTVLAAGVGKYVDVLPIHYSNGGGVLEAREDLAAAGCKATVWDNETAKGINAWRVPPLEQLKDTRQANWVLTQWTDELAAGCEKIIYFGGRGDPAGNYSYLLDDLSPRPVAATLAVLASKMYGAKPVGVFSLGKSGLFHLFARDGKPILVCSSYETSETVALQVGTEQVRITDYQGNGTLIDALAGEAKLSLAPLRYFLEDADLDVLKAYVVPAIQTHLAARKRTRLVDTPRVSMTRGETGTLHILLRNLYDRPLAGRFRLEMPEQWPAVKDTPFSLKPGEEQVVPVAVQVPATAETRDWDLSAVFSFDWDKLPTITKPAALSILSTDMFGNLMPNGDFETADAVGSKPEGWIVDGKTRHWGNAEGLGLGLGKRVFKFSDTANQWGWNSHTLGLRGGQTYLYTAWVWNKSMSAGSNLTMHFADGTKKTLYDVHVFTCGKDNPHWQMYSCRLKTRPDLVKASFTPVARGTGWALYDNIRVTLFGGTDYAAESHRAAKSPRVDGKLDDWVTKCPIPLIGKNQLTVTSKSYAWSAADLNGVGYLMWDDASLYFALQVRDNVHDATSTTGGAAVEGDSVVLAFDPTNRSPEASSKALALYLSSAAPGGGSGKHTIFRPEDRSAGLRSGQLFKDSSTYEMAIERGDGTCVYEMRIPFNELGGIEPGLGGKFGFSIQLNDSDGQKRAAYMTWGGGISPTWQPARFGVVTFAR